MKICASCNQPIGDNAVERDGDYYHQNPNTCIMTLLVRVGSLEDTVEKLEARLVRECQRNLANGEARQEAERQLRRIEKLEARRKKTK